MIQDSSFSTKKFLVLEGVINKNSAIQDKCFLSNNVIVKKFIDILNFYSNIHLIKLFLSIFFIYFVLFYAFYFAQCLLFLLLLTNICLLSCTN